MIDDTPQEFEDWRAFRDFFAALAPSLEVDETIENNFKWERRFWEWRERASNPYYKNMFADKQEADDEA